MIFKETPPPTSPTNLTPQQEDAQFLQSLQPDPLPPKNRQTGKVRVALMISAVLVLLLFITGVLLRLGKHTSNPASSDTTKAITSNDLEAHSDFGLSYKVPKNGSRETNSSGHAIQYIYKNGADTAATITVQNNTAEAIVGKSNASFDDVAAYVQTVATKLAASKADWANASVTVLPIENKNYGQLQAVQLTSIKMASLGGVNATDASKQTYFLTPGDTVSVVTIEGNELIPGAQNILGAWDLILNTVQVVK